MSTTYRLCTLPLLLAAAMSTQSMAADSSPQAEPPSTPAQKVEGNIDTRSKRVLTPDDPLPEGSLLIDSGTELQTHQCAGAAAEIRGDYRIVVLSDTCPTVRIVGNFNVLRVHASDNIEIIGNDNAVTWHTVPGDETLRKKPLLTVRGQRNLVAPGD